jgi:predicted alpha/beta-fold hydrolase
VINESQFRPARWLPGPHLQTVWPLFFHRPARIPLTTERVELPDGDFLDIAWTGENSGPAVLLLHGLEGSLGSHYATGLLSALHQSGFLPLFMHFRGCSGEPNRLPRSYHSGETEDLQQVIGYAEKRFDRPVSAAIGISLGGNVLLKWLGEQADASTLRTAVAVSVPFDLNDCAMRLDQGTSRIYRNHLLKRLRASYKRKRDRVRMPVEVDVDRIRGFREFDDKVTAPLHGFRGVDHYYRESSCRQYLRYIKTPTLILHARDDPFMWPNTMPGPADLSPAVTLEVSEAGGHVGFVHGPHPLNPGYWLEERIVDHLQTFFGNR